MLPRVLWIEDGAAYETADLATPVHRSRRYDLVTVLDVSEGMGQIRENEFDYVIVDIRLDPGREKPWTRLHKNKGVNKIHSRLGLMLLYGLLTPEHPMCTDAQIYLQPIPNWVTTSKFGILSVETLGELETHLNQLGISKDRYRNKTGNAPVTILLDLIDHISGSSDSTTEESDDV